LGFEDEEEFNKTINSSIEDTQCVIPMPHSATRTIDSAHLATKGIDSKCRREALEIGVDFFQSTETFNEQLASEQIEQLTKAVLNKAK